MAFLRTSCLLHHADALLRSGFDDLETLIEISDDDMRELGIPGHDAERLLEALQQLRGPAPESDEQHPVVAFLRDCGLQQYAALLIRHGFDDLEVLLEIQDSDMRDLGMPRGHALKLAKRLRELGTAAGEAATARPALGLLAHLRQGPTAPVKQPWAPRQVMQGPQTTEAHRNAVERSWERVQSLGSTVIGWRLYRRLFQVAPHTMMLFPPEVRHKYRDWSADEDASEEGPLNDSPALKKLFGKVVNAVGCAVAGLRKPCQMVPMLAQLGSRHAHYGIRDEDWGVLGECLLLTLEECLGGEFTPEVRNAWSLVYGFMTAVMLEGLRGAVAARKDPSGLALHSNTEETCSVQSEPSTAHSSVSEEQGAPTPKPPGSESQATLADKESTVAWSSASG